MAYTYKHGDQPLEGITIQRAAGRGGFGEVYYALTDSGKQIALKYLRNNPEVELRGVAQVMNLKSPHLITIYDVKRGRAGEPFVLMEYVTGPSLTDLLQAEPNGIGPQKAAFFVQGLGAGLSYLHERGIVHRDLKPGNVFYDDGYVKIGDYGLSKHIALSAHSGNTISVGTVHYMAPEIGSGNYSKTIDIYSLGVMLYEMLTGRLPYRGSSMGEVLMRHLSDQPDLSGIAEPFASVIRKALAKKPEDRYQDVSEMVAAIVSVTDVSASLASFDASVLTRLPRRDAADDDPNRTLTQSPALPPLPPQLDAQEPARPRAQAEAVALAFDPNDPIPSIPEIPGKLDRRERGKQRNARRAQQFSEQAAAPEVTASTHRKRGMRKRWNQLFVTAVIVGALSFGLGIRADDPAVGAATMLWMLLGSIGVLLAYVFNGRHHEGEYTFYDRVIYGACGGLALLPGFAVAMEGVGGEFARIVIPLAGMLFLFNWTERVDVGRKRQLKGGTVFGHAIAGIIIGAIFEAGTRGYFLELFVLCAAQLVVLQSLAAFWPLGSAPPARELPTEEELAAHKRGGFRHAMRRADARISSELDRAAAAHAGIARPVIPPLATGAAAAATANHSGEPQSAQSAKADEGKKQRDPAQPSFVGRAASAGTSFFAKLLLLSGLAAALLFHGEIGMHGERFGNWFAYDSGVLHVHLPDEGIKVHDEIPQQVLLIPLALGTLLLIAARSHDGPAHFLRGFFGALAAIVAAQTALNTAAEPMGQFLTGQWKQLNVNGWDPLYPVFALTVGALFLLFYPKKRRGPKPIVI